jgi:hypothetical protein
LKLARWVFEFNFRKPKKLKTKHQRAEVFMTDRSNDAVLADKYRTAMANFYLSRFAQEMGRGAETIEEFSDWVRKHQKEGTFIEATPERLRDAQIRGLIPFRVL